MLVTTRSRGGRGPAWGSDAGTEGVPSRLRGTAPAPPPRLLGSGPSITQVSKRLFPIPQAPR